jgi:hypothetical protein
MAVDSQWGNVRLLLPLSEDLLDARGHTMTASGGAALSSAVGDPFGAGNALYCDGTNDYLTGTSSDFTLGTGDCSIQFWFYPVTGGHGTAYSRLFAIGADAVNGALYIMSSTSYDPMRLRLEYYSGGYVQLITENTSTISNGAWHFFQLDRVANVWSCYVDGTLHSTQTTSFNFTQSVLYVGGNAGGSAFKGYFSDVRVTAGAYRVSHATPGSRFLRPTITGTVYDSGGAKASKVVTALKRSTQVLDGYAISNGTTGAYSIFPTDYAEHVVTEYDTATYPLVDGGSGENAIIYDRVIPGG